MRNRPEHATLDEDRGIRLALIKKQLSLVRSGAVTCAQCRHRQASKLSGSPNSVTPLCAACHADRSLDRRIAQQRAERARLSR